ncbi:MAG TPA: CopD family protein [Candidatus Kapabacteria bacterium]|nr:CopD family protein [Candidatus Kapabacteria bacterium]
MYTIALMLHVLGATVWTGGHLVLSFCILPVALRERSPTYIRTFEQRFEKIGILALVIQIGTGLYMAFQLQPDFSQWFGFGNLVSQTLTLKLSFLAATALLAVDARLRIIPNLTEHNLTSLAWHVIPVTVISVLFVLVGVSFRTGGFA